MVRNWAKDVCRVKASKFIKKNEDGSYQLNAESTVQITLMMLFLYAAQLIANRFILVFEDNDIQGYFIQTQKKKLSNALESAKSVVMNLESGFDMEFDKLLGGRDDRYTVVQYKSNWIIRLCLHALSKTDKNTEMYSTILRDMEKYESTEEYDADVASEYYK